MAAVQWTAVLVLLLFALTRAEYADDGRTIERRFEELERRLYDHETVIEDLQKTVAVQQTTIQDQQATIQDLKATSQDQQVTIQYLQAISQDLQAMIQDQQGIIQDQQAMIHSQNRQIQYVQAELRTGQESRKKHSMLLQVIQRDIRNVRKMFEDRTTTDDAGTAVETETGDDDLIRQTDPRGKSLIRRQERPGIAFTAYLDHDIETANHQTVKFNKIITNEGNDYNVHTGVFTCSEPGMYLLTFNIGERGAGDGLWVRLVVNSANIADAAADTYHDTQDMQGGNSVLLRLKAGDSVWIENAGGSHVEGSDDMRWTTFSGVLLYL